MSQSHRNSGPGHNLRSILQSVDDSGPQQLVKVTGLAGQTIGEAVRSQHFGLTSNPPMNAEGLALLIGGGMDRAHILGLEHPQYRPTNLPSGATRLYDQWGNHLDTRQSEMRSQHTTQIAHQVGNVSVTLTTTGITLTAQNITLNGAVTINGSLDVEGGTVTDNGHDIGSTHKHLNVTPGAGVSGPPV